MKMKAYKKTQRCLSVSTTFLLSKPYADMIIGRYMKTVCVGVSARARMVLLVFFHVSPTQFIHSSASGIDDE